MKKALTPNQAAFQRAQIERMIEASVLPREIAARTGADLSYVISIGEAAARVLGRLTPGAGA